ncbi:MAG: hypothetical protein ACI33I_00455 [Clostridium sp.]
MSKKTELLNVIENYKRSQEGFKNKVNALNENTDLSQEGRDKRVNELGKEFYPAVQRAYDNAIKVLDSGVEALEQKWRNNTTGRLKDSNYQIGLANAIKMIETGSITNKEDFKNIINVYKDDYNALATIKNLLGTDKDKLELYTLIPKDNREYNKKALNDLRNNIESYINPFNIKDSLTMNLESMINFINTRLKDDLSIIPWEEVQ